MIRKLEKGQSLVLVTILALAFFAILAVVLDGGFLYYLRRTAQNAADAGALAGADDLCANRIAFQAKTVAETFADNNLDTVVSTSLATVTPMNNPDGDFAGGIVTVETSIDYQTFFARLIGVETVSPPAYAKAGCAFVTEGIGIMPVALSCHSPDSDPGDPLEEGCDFKLAEGSARHCEFGKDPMYIAHDSLDTADDIHCQDPPGSGLPPGTINCDLNGDGVDEIIPFSGGNRGFINLGGDTNPGTDLIKQWVEFGFDERVEFHTWFPARPGTITAAIDAFEEFRLHDEVIIPVFDQWCTGGEPQEDNCDQAITVHDEDIFVDQVGAQMYLHITSFLAFHVECVKEKTDKDGECKVSDHLGYYENNKVKTVEGCFFKHYLPGGGGLPGVGEDNGLYTVFLME